MVTTPYTGLAWLPRVASRYRASVRLGSAATAAIAPWLCLALPLPLPRFFTTGAWGEAPGRCGGGWRCGRRAPATACRSTCKCMAQRHMAHDTRHITEDTAQDVRRMMQENDASRTAFSTCHTTQDINTLHKGHNKRHTTQQPHDGCIQGHGCMYCIKDGYCRVRRWNIRLRQKMTQGTTKRQHRSSPKKRGRRGSQDEEHVKDGTEPNRA